MFFEQKKKKTLFKDLLYCIGLKETYNRKYTCGCTHSLCFTLADSPGSRQRRIQHVQYVNYAQKLSTGFMNSGFRVK